jgi:hypothetical protein
VKPLSSNGYDTVFALPAVDAPAEIEVGVIILGLSTERLLAGLGVSGLTGDPTTATLIVDQLRHGATDPMPMRAAIAAGATTWRASKTELSDVDPGTARSASVRASFTTALRVVATAGLDGMNPARHAYLAACWLRRVEVERFTEDQHDLPEVPA